MAKVDKEYEWRMQGMLYAYKVAEEFGVDGLLKEIKRRRFLQTNIAIPKKEVDKLINDISRNMYTVSMATVCMALNEEFGFGKKRLQQFKKTFTKTVENVFDFDRAGQHYVTLSDYAKYLNDRFNLDIDEQVTESCQNGSKTEKNNIDRVHIDDVIDMLNEKGFTDASQYLAWLKQK